MAQPSWPERLTAVIAGEVRRNRQQRGMSTQQLADRCDELGFPIGRSVLANLENGRRETVSVQELLVLAVALDAPPVLLLLPLGHQAGTELLPGRDVATWDAVKWVAGDAKLSGLPDDPTLTWPDDDAPVQLHQRHDRLMDDLTGEPLWLGALTPGGSVSEARDAVRDIEKRLTADLRSLRKQMRDLGLTPPQLPPQLAAIDKPAAGRGRKPG